MTYVCNTWRAAAQGGQQADYGRDRRWRLCFRCVAARVCSWSAYENTSLLLHNFFYKWIYMMEHEKFLYFIYFRRLETVYNHDYTIYIL